MKCKICEREAQENGFCALHLLAYKNILEKFDVWERASNVSWRQYLVEIQKNSLTGEWAKEVIKHLIKDENQECHHIK
ncbi:MAG: hypothetical protein NWE95_10015 [Candidatus Bathyarchaeota archaeon]|jgi:hypothetical protein|nr:hypothetical protein [Candidatus Bathyarchaeota archaeon]